MTKLNALFEQALAGPGASDARSRLRRDLGVDELNLAYFLSLYSKHRDPSSTRGIEIFEAGRAASGNAVAYPTAIAPDDLLRHLPCADYSALKRSADEYASHARDAILWTKKMQAGSGSSMTRTSYLSRILGIPEKEVRIGAKGTDLFVEVRGTRCSLAELQCLRGMIDQREGQVGEIAFHDIVSSETRDAVRQMWKKPCLLAPGKSYEEAVRAAPGLSRWGETFQSTMPTIDEEGKISFNRKAPAGHALFGVDALRAAYLDEMRPSARGKTLVAAVSNGEDMAATPDPVMVGYVVKNRIPILMVTTERTANDMKGGMIALVRSAQGEIYATIIETAQAKAAGQLELFEKIGLEIRVGDRRGFMNTNMALFNYEALAPRLKALVEEVGEDELMRIIAPDLIPNWKEQRDPDGVVRRYLQLEGAMGSSLMNLDRYWRRRYGEPLVSFVNVGRSHRTDFFSPIKSAFDFFMQFHSDRFSLDTGTMRLVDHRPGELPAVSFKGKEYEDVQYVLDAFQGTGIRELDRLEIEGGFVVGKRALKGKVRLVNRLGGRVRLEDFPECPAELRDVKVEVDSGNRLRVTDHELNRSGATQAPAR